MDNKGVDKWDLSAYCWVLAHDFKFADELNSQARQASAERTWWEHPSFAMSKNTQAISPLR